VCKREACWVCVRRRHAGCNMPLPYHGGYLSYPVLPVYMPPCVPWWISLPVYTTLCTPTMVHPPYPPPYVHPTILPGTPPYHAPLRLHVEQQRPCGEAEPWAQEGRKVWVGVSRSPP